MVVANFVIRNCQGKTESQHQTSQSPFQHRSPKRTRDSDYGKRKIQQTRVCRRNLQTKSITCWTIFTKISYRPITSASPCRVRSKSRTIAPFSWNTNQIELQQYSRPPARHSPRMYTKTSHYFIWIEKYFMDNIIGSVYVVRMMSTSQYPSIPPKHLKSHVNSSRTSQKHCMHTENPYSYPPRKTNAPEIPR